MMAFMKWKELRFLILGISLFCWGCSNSHLTRGLLTASPLTVSLYDPSPGSGSGVPPAVAKIQASGHFMLFDPQEVSDDPQDKRTQSASYAFSGGFRIALNTFTASNRDELETGVDLVRVTMYKSDRSTNYMKSEVFSGLFYAGDNLAQASPVQLFLGDWEDFRPFFKGRSELSASTLARSAHLYFDKQQWAQSTTQSYQRGRNHLGEYAADLHLALSTIDVSAGGAESNSANIKMERKRILQVDNNVQKFGSVTAPNITNPLLGHNDFVADRYPVPHPLDPAQNLVVESFVPQSLGLAPHPDYPSFSYPFYTPPGAHIEWISDGDFTIPRVDALGTPHYLMDYAIDNNFSHAGSAGYDPHKCDNKRGTVTSPVFGVSHGYDHFADVAMSIVEYQNESGLVQRPGNSAPSFSVGEIFDPQTGLAIGNAGWFAFNKALAHLVGEESYENGMKGYDYGLNPCYDYIGGMSLHHLPFESELPRYVVLRIKEGIFADTLIKFVLAEFEDFTY